MEKAVSAPAGHETSDVRVGPLLGLLVLLALGCVFSLWLMRAMFRSFEESARSKDRPGHVLAEARQVPPPPRLEVDPRADDAASVAREQRILESYGWIDRDAGLVRIPRERALELVLLEGLPVRKATR